MATLDELDERLRQLEIRANATPLAAPANPITIGELTDVPAPNSPINAQFHQEVANRIVHRFATVAAMNAWAAGDGSLAFVTANVTHYRRQQGTWTAIVDVGGLTPINNNIATLQAQVAALQKQMPSGVQAALVNVNTNASGDARINFSKPFSGVPAVAATVAGANSTIASVYIVIHSQDANGFSVRAFFGTNHDVWSGLLAVGYVASGQTIA